MTTRSLIRKNNGGIIPSFRSVVSELLDTERFFENELFQKEWIPAVNVKEKNGNYEIEVAAPGLKKNDFDISIDNGILTISAEKQEEKVEEEENYTRREFSYNSFKRSFSLPENVNEEKITAKYDDGVLRLAIAKTSEAKAKHKKVAIS